MVFVNFKTYAEGTGENALNLLKILEEVADDSQIKVIPVLQAADIKEATLSSKLEIWAQKIDPVTYGAFTGAILAEAVFEDGAVGTFLNHSESKFVNFDELASASDRANEVGLKTLIFAADEKEFENILSLRPTFAAYEPPELVGGRVSVVSAKPEIISQVNHLAAKAGIPLIVGAGIHTNEDIRKSLELGAVGVAVSSDIVKAEDPRKELLELIEGFK